MPSSVDLISVSLFHDLILDNQNKVYTTNKKLEGKVSCENGFSVSLPTGKLARLDSVLSVALRPSAEPAANETDSRYG